MERPCLLRAVALLALGTLAISAARPVTAAPDDARRGPTRRALLVESEYDALRVPHHADLAPRDAITIELWLKRDAVSAAGSCGTLVSKDRADGYWLAVCDGRLRFGVGSVAFSDGNTNLPVGRWVHVAATQNGAERRFYVDGALDGVSRENFAPLTDGRSDLVIGADVAPGAPFSGKIDHVRLWRVSRSEAQIRDGRRVSLGAEPGLVAQWPLDGNAEDLVGGHDGRAAAGASYTFDGVLPDEVTLPLTEATVTMDGRCEATEYGSAERVAIDSSDAPRVYLQVTATDIHVCVADLDRPNSSTGYAAIYLDRNASRDEAIRPGDYRFSVNLRGTEDVEEPDGRGGWRDVDLVDGAWEVERHQEDDRWSAEFRVSRAQLERPIDPDSPVDLGLAVTISTTRSDSGEEWWPVGAVEREPATWAPAGLAEEPGLPPRFTFAGRVERAPEMGMTGNAATAVGLAGARVQLYLVDEERLSLVDEDRTDAGGVWSLAYQGYAPERFVVREIDPRGAHSVMADAGGAPEGDASAPDVLVYDLGEDPDEVDRAFRSATFVDRVGPPPAQTLGRHYLIVYADPVEEADLWPLVDAKMRQGFTVRWTSTTDLMRSGRGRDLGERIHNWIEEAWEAVEPEPVYALLVGRGDRIPVRDVGWLDNDHREPDTPEYYPAWPTDWYYADLDSGWDADGDGFHGEFMRCRPGETYPDPEEGRLDCPEPGSLTREGPFGTLRGSEDDFEPDVSVGRIAVSEPGEVRRALQAAVAFEESGSPDKRRALLAGGFWTFEGRSWIPADTEFAAGGTTRALPWVGMAWDGERPYGHDTATAMDSTLRLLLQVPMDEVSRLYETASPNGDVSLRPSAIQPDAGLTAAEFASRWSGGRYALVNLAGPGAPEGLVTGHWTHDWDRNRQIDQPARPNTCSERQISPLEQVGAPCWEVIPERFAGDDLGWSSSLPPIVVANAGLTGNVAWDFAGQDADGDILGLRFGPRSIAGTLAGRGAVAAWLGSMSPLRPGTMDGYQAAVNSFLLNSNLRLGDAHWRAAAALARSAPFDMRSYGPTLFGDPALTYWGNPADSAGAWPQLGGDWHATGSSPHSGPALPETAWTLSELVPSSPVVIGSDGLLYTGGAGRLLRLSSGGNVIGQASPPGASGTLALAPAVATDGVYVVHDGSLYLFDRDLGARGAVSLPGGATVNGAPRIDGEGAVWVPTRSGMVRVVGDNASLLQGGEATGEATFLPDGRVAWPTASGTLATWQRDRTGEVIHDQIGGRSLGRITAASVSAEGTLYVGSDNGRLYAFPFRDGEAGVPWQVNTGAAIRVRPVLGPGGVVYAANDRGTVLALAAETGTELWRAELGSAIAAAPAVDSGQVYVVAGLRLHALMRANGEMAWSRHLEGTTDRRSTPVLGPDRTIYVTRSDGALVALREAGWLSAPAQVRIEDGPGGATVRWRDTSSGEIGFRVELCDMEHDCAAVGVTGAGATSLDATDLPAAGAPYYARVLALGRADAEGFDGLFGLQQAAEANKSSEWSRSAWAVAPGFPPLSPTDMTVEAESADAMRVSWDYSGDPGQLVGFRISRAERRTGPFTQIAFVGADVREHLDGGLEERTAYTYRVVAVGEQGSSPTVQAEGETKALALVAPDELRIDASRERVILRWTDRERNEDGYIVERRAPGTDHWSVIGRLQRNARFFVDSAYLDDGQWHYRVRAVGEEADSPWTTIGSRIGAVEEVFLYLPFARQRK